MSVITITRGDAYEGVRRLVITALDAEGEPYDLTGQTLRFGIFASRRATSAELLKTTADGIEIATPQTGATKGIAYVELTDAETADLPVGGFPMWELEAEDGSGPLTLNGGRLVVKPELIVAA